MSDRKMIKWQPFDSVMNSKKIVNELNFNKGKINIPILSEEQLLEIENNIIKAYECDLFIKIKYLKNGDVFLMNEKIKYIDKIKKRITFKNYSIVYFTQIINASLE